VPLSKPPVSQSKTIMISWTSFLRNEANFHVSGNVNKQNIHFWAQAQPYEHQYCPLSVQKVTVWCALGPDGIIGSYWFEDADGHPVIVKAERYVEPMRRKSILALRRKRGLDMYTAIYQQDGATPHCSSASLE